LAALRAQALLPSQPAAGGRARISPVLSLG